MFMILKSMKGFSAAALGLALLAPLARADEPKDSNPPAKKVEQTPAKKVIKNPTQPKSPEHYWPAKKKDTHKDPRPPKHRWYLMPLKQRHDVPKDSKKVRLM